MISETATELVRGNDPSMFWIAVALLIIIKLVITLKSVYFSD